MLLLLRALLLCLGLFKISLKLKTIPVSEGRVRSLETVQQHYSNKLNSTSFFNICKVALQTQKTISFSYGYTHKEVQVRKHPEQGSYLKFKEERNNLAGDFNLNTANTTKPLSFQFHLPYSFAAGSSSAALPKVILGKRKITTELIGTEQLIPALPVPCKLPPPQLSQLLRPSFTIAASIKSSHAALLERQNNLIFWRHLMFMQLANTCCDTIKTQSSEHGLCDFRCPNETELFSSSRHNK